MDAAGEPPRDVRPPGERPRAEHDELPAGQLVEHPDHAAGELALEAAPLEHDQPPLPARAEELRVDAGREDAVVAGEPLCGRLRDLRRGGDERVDSPEQPLSLRLARRIPEALRREEARDRDRARVPEGEVREARQPGLEAVNDVIAAAGERDRQACAGSDGDAHAGAARDRDRRAERDQVGVGAVRERAPSFAQIGGPARGSEHGHAVPELAQLGGDTGDVVVDLVGHRPGERRDEADPHRREVSSGQTLLRGSAPGVEALRPSRRPSPASACAA